MHNGKEEIRGMYMIKIGGDTGNRKSGEMD